MKKRKIILSLICVIVLAIIFISITISTSGASKSLNKNSSKKEYSVDQPSLSNENLEEEKSSNKESNIDSNVDDDASKIENEKEVHSNKNTNVKTNSNTNSNKVSNSNKSSSTNKITSNNKTNSNTSSTNVIPSNNNKPSNTNSQNNDAKEWEEFVNSEAVYKILGGHKPDYYSEKEAKKKQDELLDLGYIPSLRYACMDLSTGEKCVYSVVVETGSGECSNSSSLEYDWRKVSKMGVVDYLVSKGYKCDGLTDPYSGKSY